MKRILPFDTSTVYARVCLFNRAEMQVARDLAAIKDSVSRAAKDMGYFPLKPKQIEAIHSFMLGNDTFVSLPTGYGKSAIYAVLPIAFDYFLGCKGSIAVVVSPLISLMMDQRQKIASKGLSVEFVGEAQTDDNAIRRVIDGDIQLVYISPESLLENRCFWTMFRKPVYQDKMVAFVVDEAHCV
ncbi:ATP-dependent DNA helicase RecQ-like [Dysidea avara]|uniref:ATP-dependent DNA helicase RecQ-like n=1 Tax=Dysidea avara TaxID=196820 RepID=UPI0033228090